MIILDFLSNKEFLDILVGIVLIVSFICLNFRPRVSRVKVSYKGNIVGDENSRSWNREICTDSNPQNRLRVVRSSLVSYT